MENSSIINSTMGDLGGYYVPQKYYDPNSSARICCIELPNNSQIFIKYKETSTVKDILISILNTKEYKQFARKRNVILDSLNHLNLYDLQICLYRQIKPEYENKISYDFKIDALHEKGLLKNQKYAFFIFKDNKTPFSFAYNSQIKSDLLRSVIDNQFDQNTMYSLYLPRVNPLYKINNYPELEDFFIRNKKGLNEFTPFNLNPLLNDHDKFDWFIYDNESMNFMIDMNKTNIEVKSILKLIKNKLYFEDIMQEDQEINIKNEELQKFYVNLIVETINPTEGTTDQIIQKVKISTTTTGFDLLEKMNKKLLIMNENCGFESKKMILKVRSLNDYVFDIARPMINNSYIQECIKHGKEAEYIILPNPIYFKEENENNENNENNNINENDVNVSNMNYAQNMTCEHFPYDNLLNLACYNPMNNNINSDIGNANVSLSKTVSNNVNKDTNQEDNLDLFINSLTKDINTKIQEDYDVAVNNTDTTNIIKDPMNEKYEVEDLKELNKKIEATNLNNTTMINTNVSMIGGPNLGRMGRKRISAININMPNVFASENQNFDNNDCKNLCNLEASSINIRDIERPFSILLRGAHIKDFLNSTPYDTKKITSIFVFKVQLFLGSEPFSKAYELTWKNSTKDFDPEFNKRIYFDINYNTIPNFCSILFRVKFLQYHEDGTLFSNSTKYWGNFRLFDHNLRLKCGLHKLNLYNRLFTDDAYYYFSDSDEEEKSSKIYFEIENFSKTVFNKITHIKNFSFDVNTVMINDTDQKKINEIQNRSPFETLTNYDKEILWSNRYKLSVEPKDLSKVLLCTDYNNKKHLIELEKLLMLAKPLNIMQCIELLSGKYMHESIRNFAVNCLKKIPNIEIREYLYELIHGLRYEMNHDNELARFLLDKAIKYPVTIGHNFYWLLKSQMYEQNFQQRYGLYLEIFLNKIGPTLTKIFYDEDILLTNLQTIADAQSDFKKNRKEKLNVFSETIQKFNETLENEKNEISLPLDFRYRIKKINPENCNVILKDSGKHVKLILSFKNSDRFGDDLLISYYNDQDIRSNLIIMQLYNIVHTIWIEKNLKLNMPLYNVITTSRNKGLIQLIPESKPYDEILSKNKKIKKYFTATCGLSQEDILHNFLTSSVAYAAANFVFGITQRNKRNIMVKKNAEVYYVSYEHLLNHYSKMFGDRGIPFYYGKSLFEYLGEEGIKKYKDLFLEAYTILRNNGRELIALLRILLSSGFPEISQKSINFLDMTLSLNKNEEEAKDIIIKSLNMLMTK